MNALEVFGPSMTVILIAVAIGYFLLSFAPVIWPAFVAYRHRSWFPRPVVFALVALHSRTVSSRFSRLLFFSPLSCTGSS
ncbi:hypothetical protein [Luteimonas deserti]|uniref:Uncharacterized protein n=1 Tax=Luteimonas deserti TaxID=2752306 RepID=A0A7Z0QRC3_9GAMM|nr:hypothetical protein [Luteimonas deserti]NYZ63431.1 hypothetical protein [Luteimonas deserti]